MKIRANLFEAYLKAWGRWWETKKSGNSTEKGFKKKNSVSIGIMLKITIS